jgi:hypothetical protein
MAFAIIFEFDPFVEVASGWLAFQDAGFPVCPRNTRFESALGHGFRKRFRIKKVFRHQMWVEYAAISSGSFSTVQSITPLRFTRDAVCISIHLRIRAIPKVIGCFSA